MFMSFWLVVILRGKRLPGKVLVLILGSRNRTKACMMIKNKSQGDAWQAGGGAGVWLSRLDRRGLWGAGEGRRGREAVAW